MIFETKFDLGQQVHRVGRQKEEPFVLPCSFCRGSGQARVSNVADTDAAYVPCPRCRGRGLVRLWTSALWQVIPGEWTIGGARLERWDVNAHGYNGVRERDMRFERDEERYMLRETGFPSGSVFFDTEMFATLAEAEEEVDRRNELIETGPVPAHWKPARDVVCTAAAFLEHRDVYEHEPEHVETAERILRLAAAEEEAVRA